MLNEREAVIRRMMLVADGVVITGAFLGAYFLRTLVHIPGLIADAPERFNDYLVILFMVAPVWCFWLFRNGIYSSWRQARPWRMAWAVLKATLEAVLLTGAALFLFKVTFVSRLFLVMFAGLGFLGLVGEKLFVFSIVRERRRKGLDFRQLLIIGTGRRAAEFVGRIRAHSEWGLRVVGAVEDERGRNVVRVEGVEVIGHVADLPAILHRVTVDEVVIVVPRLRLSSVEKAVRECEIEGVPVAVAVDLFEMKIARACPTELNGTPLLSFRTTVPSEWQLLAKRAIDLAIALPLIGLLSPFFLVLVVLIRATSPGPAFFRQERVGLNKRRFLIFKFRTMSQAAQKDLAKVDIYEEIYGREWKNKKMAYVTPVGRWLRKFSLDELPQLFNVVRGHMSLVGPRPTLPSEVEQYQTWFRRRFSMRPGMTCLWQVSGRRDVLLDEWMQMDLEYLDNWSLSLDIKILLKTIPAALFGRGAY
jgi:exopolysaccharide biosynthesis polyprenyl glycosylphosphotransferase